MKRRFVFYNFIIVITALLLLFGLGIVVTRQNNLDQAEEKIVQLTKIYASNYSLDFLNSKVDNNIRLTVVDSRGDVLSDSHMADVSAIENHIEREEIVSAQNGQPKTVIRFSSTIGKDMIYYAEKVAIGDTYVFLRVAIPVESVNSFVLKTIPLMLGIIIVALMVSLMVSMLFGKDILKPLDDVKRSLQSVASGTYTTVMPTTKDSQVNEIIADINNLSEKLKNTITTARIDKQKLDYIINNVTDGIVVFGEDQCISLINKKASSIFGVVDGVNRHVEVLSSDKRLAESVLKGFESKNSAIFDMCINEKIYLCAVKYTENNLVIVVLSDVTASRNNEKMRSDFFANASHELKTPLTSIIGFNELVSMKSQNNEVQNYSEKIKRESSRMLILIDDMLNLSKLENLKQINAVNVDVKSVALEVVDSLSILAKNKSVKVNVIGNGKIVAEKEHIFELIKNLTENAITYNNKEGKVDIIIKKTGRKTHLIVTDNGIGIDDIHQNRIFERFYRVDKSRSRETGGTGLGLSIVKHVAELYNAQLVLTSKLGVGTTVEVIF